MEYKANINGIDIEATYSQEAIDAIFIPLLQRLSRMHDDKKKRILVMLAAPPGAGKSTLVSFLEELSKEIIPGKKLQSIGMDGFHRRQEYLLTHKTIVDGREIPMVDIKGAPVTFDSDGLRSKIQEVSREKSCKWPIYDRLLHNPVEDAVTVDGDIVLLEGNYLLADIDGFRNLSDLADYTISISAPEELLRKRLIDRKEASGNARQKAEEFVDFSDMANVRLCLTKTKKADLELFVDPDTCEYRIN